MAMNPTVPHTQTDKHSHVQTQTDSKRTHDTKTDGAPLKYLTASRKYSQQRDPLLCA